MGGVQFQSMLSTLGEVSARVPFFLFHQTPRDDIENEQETSISPVPAVSKPPRMVRYAKLMLATTYLILVIFNYFLSLIHQLTKYNRLLV